MRLLIYSGFSIKQRDDYGQTALHLACINGSLSAVRALCERVSRDHLIALVCACIEFLKSIYLRILSQKLTIFSDCSDAALIFNDLR